MSGGTSDDWKYSAVYTYDISFSHIPLTGGMLQSFKQKNSGSVTPAIALYLAICNIAGDGHCSVRMRHKYHTASLIGATMMLVSLLGFFTATLARTTAKHTDFGVDAPCQVSFNVGYTDEATPAGPAPEFGVARSTKGAATRKLSQSQPYQPIGTVMDRVMTSPTWSLLATAIATLLPDDVRAFLNTATHAYTLFGPDNDAFEATRLALGLPNMEALMSHPLLPPVLMTHISIVLHTSAGQLADGQFISTLSPSGWTLKVRFLMRVCLPRWGMKSCSFRTPNNYCSAVQYCRYCTVLIPYIINNIEYC